MIFPFIATAFSLEYSWADQWARSGWRVQQNIFDRAQCRLLNPVEAIVDTGPMDALIANGKRKAKKLASKNAVIVLHGIGRTRFCMQRLTDTLRETGLVVADLSYPSTQQSFADCVRQVQQCVAELLEEGIERVHFVGHSLGGLIARAVIHENKIPLGKVITIGTPHNGSLLADVLSPFQPYRWMTGDCGRIITRAGVARVPMPDIEMMVIAGGNGWNGYNLTLAGDNDGVVKVTETRIPNESSFHLVPSIHSYLTENKAVIDLILKSL